MSHHHCDDTNCAIGFDPLRDALNHARSTIESVADEVSITHQRTRGRHRRQYFRWVAINQVKRLQTQALRTFASEQGFSVSDEWVFEDEGFSGAILTRPGLEKVRDLAAEGQIDAVLIYAPDRLSSSQNDLTEGARIGSAAPSQA